MKTHNFKIVGGDTDSIMFCKHDMKPFSEEEQESLIKEINSLLPSGISFKNDGIFPRVIYLKAKNYIMVDEKGKRKIKGSALKSATLEPILKQMLNEFIDAIIDDKINELVSIYNKYIKQASNIIDIKPWAKKVTLSATTYKSERKNETNIIDAIQGTEFVEGDKVWIYTASDGSLKLAERFNRDYNVGKYYEKIYRAAQRFETILPTKEMFPNYKLKKNLELLNKI